MIASDSGFIPLDLPNKTIDTALKKNSKIFFSDLGHFNNYGNKLFGEAVFEQLLDYQKFNLWSFFNDFVYPSSRIIPLLIFKSEGLFLITFSTSFIEKIKFGFNCS